MFRIAASLLLLSPATWAFQPLSAPRLSTKLNIVPGDTIDVKDKIKEIVNEKKARIHFDLEFDTMLKKAFPGAMSNNELEKKVATVLDERGFNAENTLLATSLCADELARNLEDDFVRVFGDNFNLGGLSGFPFAGNTGFGAMAAHIPDNGYCLIIYGPHVGIAKDGTIGKVERQGIALVDNCCGSAIAASNYLLGITDGGAQITTKLQQFSDFQQGAVQKIILPHGKRLADAEDRMKELPYALYDSQDVLMNDIFQAGCSGTKQGTALLGGIQINTGPDTPDYFHPLRFDYCNNAGEICEDLLELLTPDSSTLTAYLETKNLDAVEDEEEYETFKTLFEASIVANENLESFMKSM